MIKFPDPAIVRDLPRAEILERGLELKWWGEFQAPMRVEVQHYGPVIIPAGFLTDGASVPRVAWSLLSDTDPDILYPSYLHDYLYACNGLVYIQGRSLLWSRRDCDELLSRAMDDIGASDAKVAAVYLAVRLFGGPAWNSKPCAKKLSIFSSSNTRVANGQPSCNGGLQSASAPVGVTTACAARTAQSDQGLQLSSHTTSKQEQGLEDAQPVDRPGALADGPAVARKEAE